MGVAVPGRWTPLKCDYGPNDGIYSMPFADLNKLCRFANELYSDAGEIDRTPDGSARSLPIVSSYTDDGGDGSMGGIEYLFAHRSFPARISANNTASSFDFIELTPAGSAASGWGDKTEGRTGTAWEVNGNTTIELGASNSLDLRVAIHTSPEGVFWFTMPIPYMAQYEVITALTDGAPEVTNVRVSSE